MDLLLDIDPALGRRDGVETAIRRAIQDGRLVQGAALPSTRALADQLGIARGTAIAAYEQLITEGYLRASPRARTTVALSAPACPVSQLRLAGASGVRLNLHPGEPDLERFPASAWADAIRRASVTIPAARFGYGDFRGAPELRAALADYLNRARGMSVSTEDILICSGYTDGLRLVAGAMQALGMRRVAMEDPGPPHHRDVAAQAGLVVDVLEVDADGADPATVGCSRLLVTTPAHQFPLGMTMAPARRAEVIQWARAADAYVIEDDYDGELRYDRQPIGALQGLGPDRVIYIGTASKSLGPGLRIGWIVAPRSIMTHLHATMGPHNAVGILDQLALASFITSHRYERQLRHLRAHYERRRAVLLDLLRESVPSWTVHGVAAGLHVVLVPKRDETEERIISAARSRGINLFGLKAFWHDQARFPGVLIGYGRPPQHEFDASLAALRAVLLDHHV